MTSSGSTLDLNECDESGQTPLHQAAAAGNVAVVERLLLAGADPNVSRFSSNETPLHDAVNLEVARLLVDHGADIEALNFSWYDIFILSGS
jgi:ankyrin repeat protein